MHFRDTERGVGGGEGERGGTGERKILRLWCF